MPGDDETGWTSIDQVPRLVAQLYDVVDELEQVFPGRHFTPDGHLVGSLGEGLAAYLFGLELNPASAEGYDALLGDIKVEVKATQGRSIGISAADRIADHLIAIRLSRDTRPQVIFNGPAVKAWELAGKPQKTGQRQITLSRLVTLDATLGDDERLPMVRSLDHVEWGPSKCASPADAQPAERNSS